MEWLEGDKSKAPKRKLKNRILNIIQKKKRKKEKKTWGGSNDKDTRIVAYAKGVPNEKSEPIINIFFRDWNNCLVRWTIHKLLFDLRFCHIRVWGEDANQHFILRHIPWLFPWDLNRFLNKILSLCKQPRWCYIWSFNQHHQKKQGSGEAKRERKIKRSGTVVKEIEVPSSSAPANTRIR